LYRKVYILTRWVLVLTEHFTLMERKLVHNRNSSSRFQKCRVFCLIFKSFLLCIPKKERRRSQGMYKNTSLFFVFLEDTSVTFTNGKHCSDGLKS
jgi:hypothetical protein